MSLKKSVVCVFLISLLITPILLYLILVPVPEELMLHGIYIENIYVGGMTREEAEAELRTHVKREQNKLVIFGFGKRQWSFTRGDLGLTLNTAETLKKAMAFGKEAPTLHRCWQRILVRWNKVDFTIPWVVDLTRISSKLRQSLGEEFYCKPRSAFLKIGPRDTVTVVPSRRGREVEIRKVLPLLRKYLEKGDLSPIPLPVRDLKPRRTTEEIKNMQITGLLGAYTTYFSLNQKNRTQNIRKAAAAFQDLLIPPGEIFSFNETVGPRTQEAGYKEAVIIEGKKFTLGVGGGVCQVSSTLYNAVLRSNLEVIERHKHSLPVVYVPPGMDATVAYDYLDLVFKNNTSGYLLLKTKVEGNALTIKIFGNHEDETKK